MGHYAEWPDNPCTVSGGLERHKHNVVRPTPLSPSSHCQYITSSGPVGNVTSDVWMCITTFSLLSLQRAWRSTSVNLARWRSAWWCGIPLPSGRGRKEACAFRRPITGCLMSFHAFPSELFLRCFSFLFLRRGFGFVTYAEQAGVEKVLAQNRHELDSKTVSCAWMVPVSCFGQLFWFVVTCFPPRCILSPTVWLVKSRSAFWSGPLLLLLSLLISPFKSRFRAPTWKRSFLVFIAMVTWGPGWGRSPCKTLKGFMQRASKFFFLHSK